MASNIRHASAVKPISIPVKADLDPQDWDRVISYSPATSQPSEKLYEIGRLNSMVTAKDVFEATLSITQLEVGTIDAYKQLSGLSAEPSGGFDLADFDDALTDFYFPGKDAYDGTVEQTLWMQHMSLDSFGISMNANERIERTFDFSGEFAKILRYANKYLIMKTNDAPSGTTGAYNIVLNDPAPVIDPNLAGRYILNVYRIRAGVATQLEVTTDYTWTNGTTTLTILAAQAADHFRIWYSAGSYGTAGDPTSLNDTDDYYLKGDNITITIDDGTHTPVSLTKLTSLSIDVTLNRLDEGVLGSSEKILQDIESYEVSWGLEGYAKDANIEEAFMGQAGQSYQIIDFTLFSSVTLRLYIYKEATKTNFLIGYKSTTCDFVDGNPGEYNANEFGSLSFSASADNLVIATSSSDIDA